MSNLRSLEETPLFTQQLEAMGDVQYTDEALNALTWALARRPEEFPIVPGTNGLRLAKTIGFEREGHYIAPLKVWFTIKDENRVILLAITREELPDSDSQMEIPF